MMRFPALILLIIAGLATSAESQWRVINQRPQIADLNDIALFSTRSFVAVGTSGAVQITRDSGASWRYLTVGVDADLHGVAFRDTLHGVAVGDNGTIARTSDGGTTWQIAPSPVGDNLYDVAMADGAVVAVGARGAILRSVDGGVTWSNVASGVTNDLLALATAPSNQLVAVGMGGAVTASDDGGSTWRPIASSSSVPFRGVAAPEHSHWYLAGDGGVILRTADAGQHWEHSAIDGLFRVTDLQFLDGRRGYVMGTLGSDSVVLHQLYSTTDSGHTWKALGVPPDYWVSRCRFLDESFALIAGNRGTIEWLNRTSDTSYKVAPASYLNQMGYTGISCSDDHDCMAIGYYYAHSRYRDVILRTTDGGGTWTEQQHDLPEKLQDPGYMLDLQLLDSSRGIIVGDSGLVLLTTDAGRTWRHNDQKVVVPNRPPGDARPLRSVSFSDAHHGIVATGYNYVLRTSDGGATWAKDSLPDPPLITGYNALSKVYQLDSLTMFAHEYHNSMFRTTDGGKSWNRHELLQGASDLPRIDITFVTSTEGWISGKHKTAQNTGDRNNSVLLHTTDRGSTWETVIDEERDNSPFGFGQIAFANDKVGIITGEGGDVQRTYDGGKTWQAQPLAGIPYQYASVVAAGIAFPAIDNALIANNFTAMLQYRERGTSSTPQVEAAVEANGLPQVWLRPVIPNPITESAKLVMLWQPDVDLSEITLKIYDLLGEEVLDLTPRLHENAVGRNAEVVLDAHTISSGLYFISIRRGGYASTRMVIVNGR